jgi:hypothetical protein
MTVSGDLSQPRGGSDAGARGGGRTSDKRPIQHLVSVKQKDAAAFARGISSLGMSRARLSTTLGAWRQVEAERGA